MSDLSVALGNFGPLHEIEVDGKKYPVKYIDQSVKSGFEKWLFSKEREAEEIGRPFISQEMYEARLDRLNKRYVQGEFAWQEKAGLEAMRTKAGMLALCGLLFGLDDMTMLKLMLTKPTEITALVQLIVKESVPVPAKPSENGKTSESGQPDPNSQGAVAVVA